MASLVFVLLLSLSFLVATCKGSNLHVTVTTSNGVIQGSIQGQTIRFHGIPYATAKRLQFPNTNVPRWESTFSAKDYGPACSQECQQSRTDCPKQMSEECLTLNIYRPSSSLRQGTSYPVMVYIHGGDFTSGSSASPLFDGTSFSSRGRIVLVTLNYRLGAFGFLSIFDKYGEATGNFGLRDQQAALMWIRNNIEAFGGDPNKVTLMGDGSGCTSIVTHLASLSSQDLFHAAILQSCPLQIPFRTRQEAQRQSEAFASRLACPVNNVTCYRDKSVSAILQAQSSVDAQAYSTNQMLSLYPWGPSIDNSEVFYNPMDIFADLGRFSNKPVIIGTVSDEGLSFVYDKFPGPLTLKAFNEFLSSSVPSFTPLTPNSASSRSDMRNLLAEIVKDYVFTCPAQWAAMQIEAKQRLENQNVDKVWVYEFSKPTHLPSLNSNQPSTQQQITPLRSVWQPVSLSQSLCHTQSCHGADIRTLFNSNSLPYIERLINEPLTRRMIQYWSNFARRESVNGAITSPGHLRALQMRSSVFPVLDPSSGFLTSSSSRTRATARPTQRFSFRPFGVRDTTQFVPASTSVLLTALKAFTYWPPSRSPGVQAADNNNNHVVMLLQSPVLLSNASHFTSRCKGFLDSRL